MSDDRLPPQAEARWPRGVRRLLRHGLGALGVRQDVDRELATHIALAIDEMIESGVAPEEARRRAVVAFGNVNDIAAECGEIRRDRVRRRRRTDTMLGIAQDVRFALRTLRRAPVFATAAVVTLALGIGVNTAVFSAVRAILLRPLPFGDADRLVAISLPEESFSKSRLTLLRSRLRAFDEVAAYSRWGGALTGDGPPLTLNGAVGTANLFNVLQSRPALGRALLPGDDIRGNDAVVVLSHGLWASRFAGSSGVVGRTAIFDGRPRTIVGVMPARFTFPIAGAQFWAPTVIDPADTNDFVAGYLLLVARLRAGVTREKAQLDVHDVIAALARDKLGGFTERDVARVVVAPLREVLVGKSGRALVLLLGAVAFILLIACVNVANLLLVRAIARRRELAVRSAMGAERRRLIRQVLTESVVLSVVGAAFGVATAVGLARLIGSMLPQEILGADAVIIDGSVLGVAALTAVAVGVVFGLVPAVRAGHLDVLTTLRGGQSGLATPGRRTMGALIVGEFALATVLTVGAALMVQSYESLRSEDPGFRSSGILSFRVNPPMAAYDTHERTRALALALEERLRALPGVTSVGAIQLLPLGDGNWNPSFIVEGRTKASNERWPEVDWRLVNPGYFQTMSIPLLRGRLFTDQDRDTVALIGVVNEALAKRDFPGEDPIGRRVRTFFEGRGNWVTIVGVVGNTKDQSLAGDFRPQLYRPLMQWPKLGMVMLLRTKQPPLSLAASAREAVWSVDRDVPIDDVRAMDDVVEQSIGQPRMLALLLGAFSLLGLALAGVGIYGVTAYVASRRTNELGLRMALGARSTDVLRLVLVDAVKLAGAGIAIGLPLSLAATRVVRAQLHGVESSDPATIVGVGVVLATIGVIAALIPAWRAARIDPVVAMRGEG